MPDANPARIFHLVSDLKERTEHTFGQVRELMGEYLGIFEYDRSQFDNKFRRKDRRQNYQLDEVLAIIYAFTRDLPIGKRCTPDEAIELCMLTNIRLEDYGRLQEFFDEDEYKDALGRYLMEHGLWPEQFTPPPESVEQLKSDLNKPDSRARGNQIFISYSKHDTPVVKEIRNILIATGYRVWQDVTRISAGSEWIDAIKQGINASCAVVLIVSENSVRSYWVREEILHVQLRAVPIIPFMIDDTPLPFGMRQISEVKAYPDFDAGINHLLDNLSPCLADPAEMNLSRRQLEIEYLDLVLDKYDDWKSRYIPMSGIVEVLPVQEDEIGETTPIDWTTEFDDFINKAWSDSPICKFSDDILQSLADMRQVLILGEAGSGKSTTLKRIAAELAEEAKLSEFEPLPVLVELVALDDHQSLEGKIKEQLGRLAFWYDDLLRSGRLALLFDGLNELAENNQNARFNELSHFTKTAVAGDSIVLLTCRTLDYDHLLNIEMSRRLFIKPLDPIRIYQFIHTNVQKPQREREELFWFLAGEDARRFWDRFVAEVNNNFGVFWLNEQLPEGQSWGYGDSATQHFYWNQWLEIRSHPNSLLQLARNPYMLVMITRVHAMQGHIPDNRAKLFQAFIDFVLLHREGLSPTKARDLIHRLANLAFAMQHSADPAHATFQLVLQYLGDESAIHVAQSANILEADETVRFTHQLLQDYFAAYKLDSEIRAGLSPAKIWPSESWWQPNKWDDVLILLAGLHAVNINPIVTWLQDAAPEIAARCITESGGMTPEALYADLADRWVTRLDEKPSAARASVGRALGIVGNDPRVGIGLTPEGLPDLDWVEIPAGTFIYGDGEERKIDTFAITRYPITYLQFQVFIDAKDGFCDDDWWEGLSQREEAPGSQSFRYANHPRERVSWYDAIAFCRWLSYRLQYAVNLPTEYQWEKAARGTDGVIYPYGDTFDPQRGNVDVTNIGQTSAVGLFSEGASPYGVLDMSGNVFEWCLNTPDEPDNIQLAGENRRSLRGGSWAHSQNRARADYRYSNRPEMRRNRIGFRIVLSG